MDIKSAICNEVFDDCIFNYHLENNVDQTVENPYKEGDIRHLLFRKNWIDDVQWHLEDEIRDPHIDPVEALNIKRSIDQLNESRTDLVELIDNIILKNIAHPPQPGSVLNTETPSWAIDRLSILALKIFHMREETERTNASEEHRMNCKKKLDILLEQRKDLSSAIDQLLDDVHSGKKILKLYRQMKMYNDPMMNPVLYKSE